MNLKKALIFGLFTAFLILGVVSMQRAMPDAKEERIYSAIKVYSPYELEKKIGGFYIVDKRDGTKESPNSADLFHRLDELEKEWGNKYVKIEGNEVLIMGENNNTVARVFLQTEKEKAFVEQFYIKKYIPK